MDVSFEDFYHTFFNVTGHDGSRPRQPHNKNIFMLFVDFNRFKEKRTHELFLLSTLFFKFPN